MGTPRLKKGDARKQPPAYLSNNNPVTHHQPLKVGQMALALKANN
jgi:hypothetical protein